MKISEGLDDSIRRLYEAIERHNNLMFQSQGSRASKIGPLTFRLSIHPPFTLLMDNLFLACF